jgi:hypothetical protein
METFKMVIRKTFILLAFVLLQKIVLAQMITNVTAQQEQNNVIVFYKLESNKPCKINLYFEIGNGIWKGPLKQVSGNVGENVKSGINSITWNVLDECQDLIGNDISFKVEVEKQKLKIGDFYQGGIVFYIKNGEGLIAAPTDINGEISNQLGEMKWEEAKKACENLELNGYNDWFLPSKDQLNYMFTYKEFIKGFNKVNYWSSTLERENFVWQQNFYNGYQNSFSINSQRGVRAVRVFKYEE